ncbi:PH domain-containing protein [Maribacter sp. SA7]|uniref:PH domain-containing protein n=1 Tax=Maribacter zhoushanensis TaxID=3030012 RepID=UPI0023EC52E8|nr:PH domain-containing protein [Maribacter zhoushanensis]MDF4201694.1 PH domain-containing protein [Maribacter zhoushanensis]
MQSSKKNWIWTITLIVTVICCAAVLILHVKNWVSNDDNSLGLRSGFYNVEIPLSELDSVAFVERIPPMQRLHGFSALEKEKGVFREFKDSLTDKKVYVFVDNINQNKLKLVYKDSSYVYFNLKDSVETVQLFQKLSSRTGALSEPN